MKHGKRDACEWTYEEEEIRVGGAPQIRKQGDLHLLEPMERGHVCLAHDLPQRDTEESPVSAGSKLGA